MKIVHKINIVNILAILLIAMTGVFAYQNLNSVLTKLRFSEIADDLNASFLEMRLAEKNYFLYNDESALNDILEKVAGSIKVMDSVSDDIIRATGEANFAQLESELKQYMETVKKAKVPAQSKADIQSDIREAGRRLREFSRRITNLERKKSNEIILDSKKGLISSLGFILISAITVGYAFFFTIVRSLKKIEKVAHSISEGNFSKIEISIPEDELGSAIKAINSMAEELQKREEQIIQSRKLASIGILTAGVAHELGNPLNNISIIAQAYKEIYDHLDRDERLEYMRKIEDETERIKNIVQNLLDFSKPKKADIKKADINNVVHKSLKLVQNMIHICNIEVQLHLQHELPLLLIDENQIVEVLINLMTNSIQASSPGDTLMLATILAADEDQVVITVSDTGKGIPPEILPNIFDPFFSTKGARGTGLGLFVSYGIIKNHGGNIKAENRLGGGTTFTIELPIPKKQKEHI